MNKFKFGRHLQERIFYGVHWVRLRKAVKILMSVVIGALVLGGLYLLFKDTVLPTLTQKIKDMVNFNDIKRKLV